MAHSDMLAYRVPGEPPQLAFPRSVASYVVSARQTLNAKNDNSIGTQEAIDLISKVASIYSPELVVGSTPVRVQIKKAHS